MPSRRRSRPAVRTTAVVTAVVLAAGAATLLPGGSPDAAADTLVPFSDCDELLGDYRDALERAATPPDGPSWFERLTGAERSVESSSGSGVDEAAAPAAAGDTGEAVGAGPSGTNVQERGVDEPDSVKLVDGLLLALSEDRLQVVRPGPTPQVLSSLPLGRSAHGGELLVQGDRVVVLLPGGHSGSPGPAEVAPMPGRSSSSTAPAYGSAGTEVLLVDVSDPADPRLLESLEIDGRYLSARQSGGVVRLVTSSVPALPVSSGGDAATTYEDAVARAQQSAREATLDQVLPQAVHRTAAGRVLSDGPAVDCEQVRRAGPVQGSGGTLLVTTLDPDKDLSALDRTAVSTDGDLVYASAERLYVATSRWSQAAGPAPDGGVTTELHAFDTGTPTATRYAGTASVDGYVYGRWALSSHEGHLRVATTTDPPWDGGGSPSGSGAGTSSSVTVLAERPDGLVETGRLDGLGPDERIYAVRYLGDLATVVTFRETDPLYVLDLGDPAAPALLGELKVPGFSTYLHPVGDHRLLAVGQDADSRGRVTGLQLSLFDVSDLGRPTQLDRLPLGRAWTPASDDSRAFTYDPGARLALLPLLREDGGAGEALGVRVTERGTLEEVGRLAVGPRSGEVERVLSDGRTVYAVSRTGLDAGDASDLSRTGSAVFLRR
jgi:hypothetical protein